MTGVLVSFTGLLEKAAVLEGPEFAEVTSNGGNDEAAVSRILQAVVAATTHRELER